MVEDLPLSPSRIGVAFGEEREERIDFVESLRRRPECEEARFKEAAARATWEGEGIGGVLAPFSYSER
jgi:hypothetical protein